MLRLRSIPLVVTRRFQLRLEPGLVLGLIYLGWCLIERYELLGRTGQPGAVAFRFTPPVLAVLFAGAVLIGLLLHELAHILVARILRARLRLTLLGLVPRSELVAPPGTHAEIEARSALAGPIVSLLLAAIIYHQATRFSAVDAGLALVLRDLAKFHLFFGLANLAPAFPFDGGRLLRALLTPRQGVVRAARFVVAAGYVIGAGLVVLAIATRDLNALFAAVYVLAGAAGDEGVRVLDGTFAAVSARQAMQRAAATVTVHASIGEAALVMAEEGTTTLAVLGEGGVPLAALDVHDIRGVPPKQRWVRSVGDLLPRLGGVVAASTPLPEARRALASLDAGALAVTEDGGVAGVLTLELIDRRLELAELAQGLVGRVPRPVDDRVAIPAPASLSTPMAD